MWEVGEELLAVNFVTVDIGDCLVSFFSYIFERFLFVIQIMSTILMLDYFRSTFAWTFYVVREKIMHIGILAFLNLFF